MNTLITLVVLVYIALAILISSKIGTRIRDYDWQVGVTMSLFALFLIMPFPILMDLGYLN